jgi:hypothetical protein
MKLLNNGPSFLLNPIARAITKVLIRLENPTANAFYSLGTDFVVGSAEDFSASGYFVFDDDEGHLFSDTNGASRIAIFAGDIYAPNLVGSLSSTAFLTDNKQHFIFASRISGSFVFKVDGAALLTAPNSDSFRFNSIAQIRGTSTPFPMFAGRVSDVSLTHITTPANSLEFTLNQLTKNYELPINNVFGSELVDWSNTGQSTQGAWIWDGVSALSKSSSDGRVYQFGGDDLVTGDIYEITYTKSNHTAGDPAFTVNSNGGGFEDGLKRIFEVDPSGTYSIIVTPTEDGALGIIGLAALLTLSDMSIRQVANALTYNNIATTNDVRVTYTLTGANLISEQLWPYGGYTYTGSEGAFQVLTSVLTVNIGSNYKWSWSHDVVGTAESRFRIAGDTNTQTTTGTFTGINYNATATNMFFQAGPNPELSAGTTVTGVSVKEVIDIAAQVTPVTDGMTLTASWVTRGTAYDTLSNAESASVRVDATISNTDAGILMEAGGVGEGLVLYVFAGVVYFQCGDGTAFGSSAATAETSYALPAGEYDYIIEGSANISNSVLYINGVEVDSQTFSNSKISGANDGTIGQVMSTVATNRGSWSADASGGFSGAIALCNIFDGQVTPDV